MNDQDDILNNDKSKNGSTAGNRMGCGIDNQQSNNDDSKDGNDEINRKCNQNCGHEDYNKESVPAFAFLVLQQTKLQESNKEKVCILAFTALLENDGAVEVPLPSKNLVLKGNTHNDQYMQVPRTPDIGKPINSIDFHNMGGSEKIDSYPLQFVSYGHVDSKKQLSTRITSTTSLNYIKMVALHDLVSHSLRHSIIKITEFLQSLVDHLYTNVSHVHTKYDMIIDNASVTKLSVICGHCDYSENIDSNGKYWIKCINGSIAIHTSSNEAITIPKTRNCLVTGKTCIEHLTDGMKYKPERLPGTQYGETLCNHTEHALVNACLGWLIIAKAFISVLKMVKWKQQNQLVHTLFYLLLQFHTLTHVQNMKLGEGVIVTIYVPTRHVIG